MCYWGYFEELSFLYITSYTLYVFLSIQVLWKSYIDFEIELEEYQKTRQLYQNLLERTQHVKV